MWSLSQNCRADLGYSKMNRFVCLKIYGLKPTPGTELDTFSILYVLRVKVGQFLYRPTIQTEGNNRSHPRSRIHPTALVINVLDKWSLKILYTLGDSQGFTIKKYPSVSGPWSTHWSQSRVGTTKCQRHGESIPSTWIITSDGDTSQVVWGLRTIRSRYVIRLNYER